MKWVTYEMSASAKQLTEPVKLIFVWRKCAFKAALNSSG